MSYKNINDLYNTDNNEINDNNDGKTIMLKDLIKKSLKHYDDNNILWNKYINNKNIEIDINNAYITFFKKEKNMKIFKYEILGYHDNNIWIWGWVMPNISNEKLDIVKKLLIYGIELDHVYSTDEYMILKSIFVNSRIKIENYISLDIHLSLIYNIIKNKILFIYSKKVFLNDTKYVTFYYLVKENK